MTPESTRPSLTLKDLLDNWHSYNWRHHGVGLMQTYLPAPWKDCRLHIWYRGLVLDGIEESGAMHNHRMHLISQVLVGELINTSLYLAPNPEGSWRCWDLEKADGKFKISNRVNMTLGSTEVLKAGDRYLIPKGFYHWARQPARYDDVTITLVDLLAKDFDVPIGIVTPEGRVPIDAAVGVAGLKRGLSYPYHDIARLAHKRLRDLMGEGKHETY